jgi:hypothetical protein
LNPHIDDRPRARSTCTAEGLHLTRREEGHAFRARPSKLIAFDVKLFNTSATRFTF